jgi:hypothetical protein
MTTRFEIIQWLQEKEREAMKNKTDNAWNADMEEVRYEEGRIDLINELIEKLEEDEQ